MGAGTETIRSSTGTQALSRGGIIGVGIAQLVLTPKLFFIGFGFLFVGMGLSPDSSGATSIVQEVVILALYAIVFLTVLLLLIGAPTLWIARATRRPRLERGAAYVSLGFAGLSVLILMALGIAGFLFDQLAGI